MGWGGYIGTRAWKHTNVAFTLTHACGDAHRQARLQIVYVLRTHTHTYISHIHTGHMLCVLPCTEPTGSFTSGLSPFNLLNISSTIKEAVSMVTDPIFNITFMFTILILTRSSSRQPSSPSVSSAAEVFLSGNCWYFHLSLEGLSKTVSLCGGTIGMATSWRSRDLSLPGCLVDTRLM